MNPDVLLIAGLALMWLAAVGLLALVCVLHRRIGYVESRLQAIQQSMQARDMAGDEQTWAAVADVLGQAATDMERTPA